MNPLRIFLLAVLVLVVFGAGKADANEYTADVVITENAGPSFSGTLNNEGESIEFGYLLDNLEWDYTQEIRISHFDVVVDWEASGGAGSGRSVNFDVSSENNTAGESQNEGGGGGTIVITWAVNELPEVVSGTADDLDTFVSSFETDGEWMGGKFTYESESSGASISDESISYTISLKYYTWELENIRLLEQPDLYISTMDFSNDNPEIGDVVIINATVRLLGTNVTGNFSVGFYLDAENGTEIGFQVVNGSEMTRGIEYPYFVSINWTAINGTHTIYVVADSTNVIDESEEKNELSKTITVGFVEPEPNETSDTTDDTTSNNEETTTEAEEVEERDYTMIIAGVGAMIAASILGAAVILKR